ncbi:MAG TPA: bifunctional diaminohydroxyphosphoribosylaminopyrimidine deaminase/5-amino-6-(5-phosphoribosylamino)uracil reductase RibD [Bacteroidota bacterium]|nr:bifunctional diaminohydroxyphosphoribosylaminopyrimidine deaminase/5-amino-6-(5-phosphoribosylamino)uracil reductase RibD [Bacteroidota bacterium]
MAVIHSADEEYMRLCFELARRGIGHVSPNPMVGAVLVVGSRVVASGYHKRFGGPHAEVECLSSYRGDASRGTLYVNLEPCSHYGKTPPCVDLILQRGIRSVVIAMKDPNPLVCGKGIRKLRRAGVRVQVGVLRREAEELNRFFVKHITSGYPYVHVKIAQTADGFIAPPLKGKRYITSRDSLVLVHRWRAEYDAVLVGANTVKTDNPRLDVRLVEGRDPVVVILDGRFSLSGNERVFSSARRRNVIVCVSDTAYRNQRRKVERLEARGIVVLRFGASANKIPLKRVLDSLHKHNIGSVLVEGGREVFSQFIEQKLVDELSIFVAPTKFGEGIKALNTAAQRKVDRWMREGAFVQRPVGADFLYTGRMS